MLRLYAVGEPHVPLDVDALGEADAQAIVRACLPTFRRVVAGAVGIGEPLWSVRAQNCLRRAGVLTLGALSEWDRCLPGAGRTTIREYTWELRLRGLPVPAWMLEQEQFR